MRTHLALALAAFAALQTSTAVDVPKTGTTVPMLDIGGRPMVEVRINGKGPYAFILDTGASRTALDADLATEIGVVDGGTGGPVHLEELRVGEAVIRGVDAGRIGGGMLRGLGPNPPRGVLSAAAFPGQLVILDYVGKRVTITSGALPAADSRRVFEYPASERLPVVPIRVAGHEYHIHLDSGSPGGVMLPMKSVADLPLAAPPVDVGQARTVAGTFPVQSATVNGTVEIGEYVLDLKEIRFSDLRPGPEPGPGNIGALALRSFVVTFDSKNRRVKFERS
jgi:hypothetical protein